MECGTRQSGNMVVITGCGQVPCRCRVEQVCAPCGASVDLPTKEYAATKTNRRRYEKRRSVDSGMGSDTAEPLRSRLYELRYSRNGRSGASTGAE